MNKNNKNNKKLLFANLGGFQTDSMQERHEFGLIAAKNSLEEKKIANSKWLLGYKKIDKDNLSSLGMISVIDDCKEIKK